MTQWIVVPNADAAKVNEGLGRLYAASLDPPSDYPVMGRFADTGEINPDLEAATYFWMPPTPGANGTETAFRVDDLVAGWLGQTVQTDLGEVTLPSESVELADSWFPIEE